MTSILFPISQIWATAQGLFSGFGGFVAMLMGVILFPYILGVIIDAIHSASSSHNLAEKSDDPYQHMLTKLTKHQKELIIESRRPLLRK